MEASLESAVRHAGGRFHAMAARRRELRARRRRARSLRPSAADVDRLEEDALLLEQAAQVAPKCCGTAVGFLLELRDQFLELNDLIDQAPPVGCPLRGRAIESKGHLNRVVRATLVDMYHADVSGSRVSMARRGYGTVRLCKEFSSKMKKL